MQDEIHQDPPGDRLLDVVVIGGGQAGLAIGWHLARQGLRFVVLEAGPEIGHVWRSRWDSLTLFTPAQYDALPGVPFPAPADTYPTKDPVADYLQAYAAAFDLPVRLNTRVTALSADRRASRSEHRRRDLPRPPGGGGHRTVPGPFRPTGGPAAGPVGDPGPQRAVPQPGDPARRAGPGRGRRQLRVPDRRGAGRHPPGRPVGRRQECRCCRSGWAAGTCSGGSPGSAFCACRPPPGWAAAYGTAGSS